MQAQQQQQLDAGGRDTDENYVAQNQPSKPKRVLSKVKQKASKIKDKVKKAAPTVSSNRKNTAMEDRDYSPGDEQTEKAVFNSALPRDEHMGASNSSDDDSSADDDTNPQLKYEKLGPVGALNGTQGDGSDVEHHDGVPFAPAAAGAYWNRNDVSTPANDNGSANSMGPSLANAKDDDNAEGGKSGKRLIETISGSDWQGGGDIVDTDKPIHDQIKLFSEDLAADRKLGVGQDEADNHEGRTSDLNGGNVAATSYPTSNPIIAADKEMSSQAGKSDFGKETANGADEQMYKPVSASDNFASSLTPESMNAHLYGDVLEAEDKLAWKSSRNAHSSDQNRDDFSFSTDLPGKMHPQHQDSQQENRLIDDSVVEHTLPRSQNTANSARDGVGTEGLGKWSEDEPTPATQRKEQELHKIRSDNYFDPTDIDNNALQHQLTLGNADEGDTLFNTALAGSVAIADAIHSLKDSVAHTLGYGSTSDNISMFEQTKNDADNEQQRDVSSSAGPNADREQKPDASKEMKENVVLGAGKERQQGVHEKMNEGDSSSSANFNAGKEQQQGVTPVNQDTEKPYIHEHVSPNSSSENGKTGGSHVSSQWSLNSASDAPQIAFL